MLREFLADFKESNGVELSELWEHSELLGIEQLKFKGNMACFSERKGPYFSIIIAGKDPKVFDHMRYLIQCFWSYWSDGGESGDLKIDLHGYAYQSIIPLKPIYKIENIYASGTLERVDRFGNSSEKDISKLIAVVFRDIR